MDRQEYKDRIRHIDEYIDRKIENDEGFNNRHIMDRSTYEDMLELDTRLTALEKD
jgi:hypothetical protein